MRTGKITRTVWQRSVRRELRTKRDEVVSVPSPYGNCSGIRSENGTEFVWTDVCVIGKDAKTGFYAVLHAAGNLASDGTAAAGAALRVMLPEGTEEELLQDIAGEAERACSKLHIQITAFQGTVTDMVKQPAVIACASGIGKNAAAAVEGLSAGAHCAEILMCGYTGLEGMLRILAEARTELNARFVDTFLDQAEQLENELVMTDQIMSVFEADSGAAVRHIGSGGILAALWELCEQEQIGFEIDMHHIPLKQETVEICELYRLNPYLMTSAGSFLILTDRADKVLSVLEKAGAYAVRLGTAERQNARIIRNGEETRYLDRPAPDEFLRWQTEREKRC